jgi:prepilin-type N-terminal cleavage/methylation domain-containing protein
MHGRSGLSIIEVIVAMAVLAIVSAALVGVLPLLSRGTQAATVDSTQSQRMYSVFEQVASDWSNVNAWDSERVVLPVEGELAVTTYVTNQLGTGCAATVTEVEAGVRKRLVITCQESNGLPVREMRAEYGR